jgi:hypothetical protein
MLSLELFLKVSPTDSGLGLGLGEPGGSFTGKTLAGEHTKDGWQGRPVTDRRKVGKQLSVESF